MAGKRPEGRPTRGKTAGNRLRRVDVFVALAMPAVLRGDNPLVVDLGYGARPWTTLEMAQRWRRIEPALRVLGVEVDRQRVEAARPFADPPATRFVEGGFDLADILGEERARIVRCMNVLRQYDEDEVARARQLMAEALEPGGILLEGTSDPTGRMVVFEVLRAAGGPQPPRHEAIVFGTNFRRAADPTEFRAVAPKRLIHRMLDERPSRFFADWERAAGEARPVADAGTPRHWARTGAILRERYGWPVDPRKRLLERGFLTLRDDLSGT